MRVALIFGSYNPIHIGHLGVADFVLREPLVDEVWFVVTPKSPDKVNMELLDHNIRFNLISKVIEGSEGFKVCDIEFDMEQPNYTNLTLDRLSLKYPEHEFSVVLGGDNVINLKTWVGVEEWSHKHKLWVIERPGYKIPEGCLDWYGDFEVVEVPEIEISSTKIRNKIRLGEPIDGLVPDVIVSDVESLY